MTPRTVFLLTALLVLAVAPVHAQEGKALYEESCARCHGSDGQGDTPIGRAMKVPALAEVDFGADPAALVARVLRESPKHASVASKVDAQEIAAIAAYIEQALVGSDEAEAR